MKNTKVGTTRVVNRKHVAIFATVLNRYPFHISDVVKGKPQGKWAVARSLKELQQDVKEIFGASASPYRRKLKVYIPTLGILRTQEFLDMNL